MCSWVEVRNRHCQSVQARLGCEISAPCCRVDLRFLVSATLCNELPVLGIVICCCRDSGGSIYFPDRLHAHSEIPPPATLLVSRHCLHGSGIVVASITRLRRTVTNSSSASNSCPAGLVCLTEGVLRNCKACVAINIFFAVTFHGLFSSEPTRNHDDGVPDLGHARARPPAGRRRTALAKSSASCAPVRRRIRCSAVSHTLEGLAACRSGAGTVLDDSLHLTTETCHGVWRAARAAASQRGRLFVTVAHRLPWEWMFLLLVQPQMRIPSTFLTRTSPLWCQWWRQHFTQATPRLLGVH